MILSPEYFKERLFCPGSVVPKNRRELVRHLPPRSVGAEIGVWKGDFSAVLLRRLRPRELHLIDPWVFQPEFPNRMYGGKNAKSERDMDAIFEGVRARFTGSPEVKLDRRKSAEAHASFGDGFFDWVYVDGNHEFDFVLQDLVNFHPKVKPGGCLCGDDYLWKNDQGAFTVRAAVEEFCARHPTVQSRQFGNQFLLHRVGG